MSEVPVWPPDPAELARAVRDHGYLGAARLYGVSRNTLRAHARRLGIRSPRAVGVNAAAWRLRQRGGRPAAPTVQTSPRDPARPDPALRDRLLAALRHGPATLERLADLLDRGPATVRQWLEALRGEGYAVVAVGDRWTLERNPAPAETATELPQPSDGVIRIGLVADTHLGSRAQQLTYLREAYRRLEDGGAQRIYHLGDVLDGVDVYRGQHAEQFLHTYDEQVDYAVAEYPRASVPTHIIGGNHDLAGLRRGDSDPLRRLCQERPDLEYLGPYSAWPTLDRLLMYLLHPDGGGAYAISYRLQKIVESFEGGRKPHVLVVGHWHQMAYIHTRNVHALYPGCFQAQTEFQRRRALQPQLGAVLLEIRPADDGSWHEVTPRFLRWFVPKEKDY